MNYAIIGVSGYIAPRHLQAIKETGGNLICAYDPHDSVGVLDSYFPQTDFFTEFERFDRHIDKLRRKGVTIDYLVICSPNYLHDSHCRYGLRNGMDVICEKPLVLNPHNAEALMEIEKETEKNINCILQLRLHPTIIDLKNKINKTDTKYEGTLIYETPRGKWYNSSWKGDEKKSGGLATNIGIHFFDMLQWLFGSAKEIAITTNIENYSEGYIDFERGDFAWRLDIRAGEAKRQLSIDGFYNIDFTHGFSDLHTSSYREILAGRGFTVSDALPSIKIVSEIRNAK